MVDIDNEELEQLRDCKLFKRLNERHRGIVEWTIRECLEIQELANEKIPTKVYLITTERDESFDLKTYVNYSINRRRLENLNVLDFDFGIIFYKNFMPFFTDFDVALFKEDVPENGDMCIFRHKLTDTYWIGFKEELGYFDLEGRFLGDEVEYEVKGVLVNIETT